jgi:hypothetical protein
MHVGNEPLLASDGWTCFYFPASDEPGWSWNLEHIARSLWSAARLIQRLP